MLISGVPLLFIQRLRLLLHKSNSTNQHGALKQLLLFTDFKLNLVICEDVGPNFINFQPRNRGTTPPKTFWLGREANTRHQAEKKRPKHGGGGRRDPKLTIKKKKQKTPPQTRSFRSLAIPLLYCPMCFLRIT